MRYKFKKGIAILIVTVLSIVQVVPSVSFAKEITKKESFPILDKYVQSKKVNFKVKDQNKKSEQKIRVIVELDASKEKQAEELIKKIPGVRIHYHYNNLLNGISLDIPNESIEKLMSIDGVVNIKKSEKLIPQTYNAKEITKVIESKAKYSKKYGLDGRGMLIATLDSGVDINHPDMRIDEDAEKDMKIKDIKAPFTKKVPFGFNYFKADHSILHDNVSKPHGMHIAGILAGNSPKKDGFKGIAPNAQLLVYKVITYDRKGYNALPWEIEYIGEDAQYHAMEDAVARGADVISLSIGSFGSGREDDIWNSVVQKCYEKGVIVVSAMGNRAAANSKSSYENFADSEYNRKDLSTGVSVAVNGNSIGAGSTRNTGMRLPSVQIDGKKYVYSDISRFNSKGGEYYDDKVKQTYNIERKLPNTSISKSFIYVKKGMNSDDLDQSEVSGKIVIADRGGEDIKAKALRFLSKGAVGFILINGATDTSDVDAPEQPVLNFNHLSIHNGWAISLSKVAGDELKKQVLDNQHKTIIFDEVPKTVKYLKQNLISGFSSWGPSYDLELKPDMVAPGENIISLGNGDSYTVQSGTSMASPHIAGISTLMLSKTRNIDDPNIKKMNLADLTRVMMMNTSEVLFDYEAQSGKTLLPYSPRLQGAGLINMESALDSDVIVTFDGKKGAASLKEIGDKTNFRLKLTNFSNKKRSFNIEPMDVLTSGLRTTKDGVKVTTSKILEGASINGDGYVTINPHSTSVVEFTLDATSANEQFVEGYIKFLPTDEDGQPILSVPYLGFKGDWAKENILDKPQWEEGSITKLSKLHKFLHEDDHAGEKIFEQLGKKKAGTDIDDPNTYMINSKRDGKADYVNTVKGVAPSITFLREAKDFDVSVVKQKSPDSRALRTILVGHYPDRYVENAYREYGEYYQNQYKLAMGTAMWDGGLYDPTKTGAWESSWLKEAPEGNYFIRIRARKSSEKPWEAIYMPVRVDNHNPTVFTKYSSAHSKIEVDISDNEGIEYAGASINGKIVHMHELENGRYEIELPKDDKEKIVRIEAMDFAGNPSSKEVKINLKKEVHDKGKADADDTDDIDDIDDIDDTDDADGKTNSSENKVEFDPHDIDFSNGVMVDYGIAKKADEFDIDDQNNPKFKVGFAYIPEGLTIEVENINTHYNYINKVENQFAPLDKVMFTGDNDSDEKWINVAEGDNYIKIKVIDNSGKVVYFNKYTLFVDLHSPVGIFSNNISIDPTDDEEEYDGTGNTHYGKVYVNSGEGEISGTVSDNLDKYFIKVNGDMVDLTGLKGHFGPKHNTSKFNYRFEAVDGQWLHIVLRDIYGNDKRYELKIVKDEKKPEVIIKNESSLDANSKIDYEVSDNIEDTNKNENVKTLVTVNGKEYKKNSKLNEYDVKGKENNYLIRIIATDLAGNVTEITKKVEKTPGTLNSNIKDYELKKDKFMVDEIKDVNNLFDLDSNIKANINDENIGKTNATIKVTFTDEFGNEKIKKYEIKLRFIDDIDMILNESLNRNLLKDRFKIGEKKILDKLFNLDDNATFIMKNKIDINKPGQKIFKARFEKGNNYFERIYRITIEDDEGTVIEEPIEIDKKELRKAIEEVKKVMSTVKYIKSSKEKRDIFDKKLSIVQKIIEKNDATQKEVDNAKDELNIAKSDLNGKSKDNPSNTGGNNDVEKVNEQVPSKPEDLIFTLFDSIENVFHKKKLDRVAGKGRIQTAVAISKRMFNKADNVVITAEHSQADALTSSLFAKQKNAPILLTSKKSLSKDTLEEIKRLKASNVYIIGGKDSVSETIEKALISEGIKVQRLSGKNRYETSEKIFDELNIDSKKDIFIVNGKAEVDALTISPVSANKNIPVLLTDGISVNSKAKHIIDGYVNKILIGGENSIKSNIQKMVKGSRISGKDRYDTSVKIKEIYFKDCDTVFLANGINYVDSLTGAVYAAKENAPILLIQKNRISKGVHKIVDKSNRLIVLGGDNSIK